jgi:hypothetical protein
MACAAASAAVAGSVNASVFVLDSFNIDSTATLTVAAAQGGDFPLSPAPDWSNWGATGTKQIAGAAPAVSGQPAQNHVFATANQTGGLLTMGVNTAPSAGTIGTSPNPSVSYRYVGSFDLSGMGDVFYFDGLVDDPTNGKWLIRVNIGAGSGTNYDAIISDVGTLVNGRYFVNFSQLMSGAGAWNSSYGAVNRVLLGLKTSADVVNGSISGTMGEFGVIPAPGTIALLAVAGVFGSRRRR